LKEALPGLLAAHAVHPDVAGRVVVDEREDEGLSHGVDAGHRAQAPHQLALQRRGLGRRRRSREVGVDERHAFGLESQGFGEQVAQAAREEQCARDEHSDTATWATTSARRRGRLS
jgi:hypothetical protein